MAPLTTRDTDVPDSLPIILGAVGGAIALVVVIIFIRAYVLRARGRPLVMTEPYSQTSGGLVRLGNLGSGGHVGHGGHLMRGEDLVSLRPLRPLGCANDAHRELSLRPRQQIMLWCRMR